MRMLILLLNQLSYQFLSTGVVMSILFNRCASLQVNSILSNFARSFSHFFPEFISSVPSCLCFSPPSHPFSSVIQFSSKCLSFHCASAIFSSVSYPVIHCEDSQEIRVHHLFILVIFSGEFNSVVRVHHILFILVILSYVGNSYQPILFIHSSLFYPECWRYLRSFLFSILLIISRCSTSSSFHLYRCNISLSKQSFQRWFLWVGP